MSNGHSILPPSGAAAWRRCALWVTMNQTYPQADTPASMEGTAAHWVATEILAGRPVTEGMIAPNGIPVTEEMLDGGELFADTIRARMPLDKFSVWNVEVPTLINGIHNDCWGTPDVWGFNQGELVLEVVDYKFGFGFVDEHENDQLVTYTAGILCKLADALKVSVAELDQALKVNLTIIQPRCFYRGAPVRTWSVLASDLRGQFNLLRAGANASMGKNPTATTNPACEHCPGSHACPALQLAGYRDTEYSVQSPPLELPPEAASLELRYMERALERLQSRVEGMREAVAAYARQGMPTPYHTLTQGYGRQAWNVPPEQVITLGSLMGIDLAKPGVKTPKQAITAGIDEAVIKAYSATPLGAAKLVPTNPADARRVFG